MKSTDLLLDAFGRILDEVAETVSGLGDEQLTFRADPGANSIAWLVWHLTRVQDNHVAEVRRSRKVWTADGWVDRFGLALDPADTGYGHRAEDVAAVRAPADLLVGYYGAVAERTRRYVAGWATPTSTGSWTSGGTRRSPSARGWSASSVTTWLTSARRSTSRGCWSGPAADRTTGRPATRGG